MPSPQYRGWVFTLNNPEFAAADLPVCPDEKYVAWQLEEVETKHIQGYVEFAKKYSLHACKKWLHGAHFEPRKGTPEQARDYAMKEDSRIEGPFERGVMQGVGKRNDLDAVKEAIKSGATRRTIMEEHTEVFAKYPRFIDEYIRVVREDAVEKLPEFEPRFDYQAGVLAMVKETPSDRQILWVYDPIGNHGKTYLAKWLVQEHNAFYTNGGKAVDLLYAYKGEPVVIFDYVRDSKEYVGYGVIEQLKNGLLMSTKYESGMRRFPVPHVIILANFRAEDGKFSMDRLITIELNSQGEIV